MARVTVEDCVKKIENRFELVNLAAQRSRQLSNGAPLLVDRDKDKNLVVALREIADTEISLVNLKENIIKKYQSTNLLEQQEDEDVLEVLKNQTAHHHEEENIFQTIEDGVPSQAGLSDEYQFEDVSIEDIKD